MEAHRGKERRARAQNILGRMYKSGDGIQRNYQKAVHCFRQAAELGDMNGQYNLARMYQHGTEVSRDNRKLYEKGIGIPLDFKEAEKWKRVAAERGEARAQNHFGVKYAKGFGFEKSYRKAYMWLSLAAVQGNRMARENIGILTDKMTQ